MKYRIILISLIVFMLVFLGLSNINTEENSTLIINEVITDNTLLYPDENNMLYDLIEIHNSSDEAINLEGYGLSDDADILHKWTFPEVIIEAGEYLVIYAADIEDAEGLYTNFALSNDGEKLLLTDNEGNCISSVVFKNLEENMSYGFDGEGYTNYLTGTPGAENIGVVIDDLDYYLKYQDLEPEVSLAGGIYSKPQTVTFNENNNYDLRYTLDSSNPDVDDNLYTEGIYIDYTEDLPIVISNMDTSFISLPELEEEMVNNGLVIKAQYFEGDVPIGQVFTGTYFIWKEGYDRYSFDVVSLSTDQDNLYSSDDGIMVVGEKYLSMMPDDPYGDTPANYNQRGRAWEREATLEIFDEHGSTVINQDIGIRIAGAYTRFDPKKSIRVYAREEYDEENNLSLALFDELKDEADSSASITNLLIRSGGNDYDQCIFRDLLSYEIAPDSLSGAAYKPVILFINGEYFGIYNLREDSNEEFVVNHYGLDLDDISIIKYGYTGVVATDENEEELQRYYDFIDFMMTEDLSVDENYEYVESMIDIDNLIDYLLTNIYICNEDFYNNNIILWRNTGRTDEGYEDGRYRYILHDTDLSYDIFEWSKGVIDTFEFLNDHDDYFYKYLMVNEEFNDKFFIRFMDYLNTNFKEENVNSQVDYLENLYSAEIEEYLARWNLDENCSTAEGWSDIRVQVIRDFVAAREFNLIYDINKTDDKDIINIELYNKDETSVLVNDNYLVEGYADLKHFSEYPLKLEFQETDSIKFRYWYIDGKSEVEINDLIIEGDTGCNSITILTDDSLLLEPIFEVVNSDE